MKVLLVYPFFQYDRTEAENLSAMPLGIYYLAASLIEAKHEVVVADWHGLRDRSEVMESELREIRPDVLGVSVFAANRWGAIQAARAAKQVLPQVSVVFGGIGATFLSRFFLENFKSVDYVLRGEGEVAFPAFLAALEQGAGPEEVPNLVWRSQDGIVENPQAPLVEKLDELPDPARYFDFRHVALSRGCPGKCSFCGSPRFWGPKVRFHSPEYLVRQIRRLADRGGRHFYVSDDTFTLRRENVLEFCRLLRDSGTDVTWQAISRVDRVDEEMLAAMRGCGCTQISYGVESGSADIRRVLNKKTTNEQIRRAFALTTRYGMVARAYIIYGNPGECEATIEESAALIDEIGPLVTLFHVLTVLPGTALYDKACAEFGLTDDAWLGDAEELLWLDLDPGLDFEVVRRWGARLKEAYRRSLPEYVRRISLADAPELAPQFADFLARLGMTFDQGDYAAEYGPKVREPLAEDLFRRALDYAPESKAFLGLGMLLHRNRRLEEAVQVLQAGVEAHPEEANLRLCLGIGLMNLQRHAEALPHLEAVRDVPAAGPHYEACRRRLDAGF